jgi:acyl-CoA thioesterase
VPKQVPGNLKGFDLFSDTVGIRFTKWEPEYSCCEVDITEKHLNPHRTVHGGVTYTLADTGMGATMYSIMEEDELCATIEIKIVYFKAVSSGTLKCDTQIVHRGNRIATLESEITNNGILIAKALGTFSIFKDKR